MEERDFVRQHLDRDLDVRLLEEQQHPQTSTDTHSGAFSPSDFLQRDAH